MKTVIMAGGKGTRISSLFPNIPKPLIEIKDKNGIAKPVLQWELESLRDQGFTDIIITVGHMAQKIIDYFGNGGKIGVKIQYFIEDKPLGNAGALFKLRDKFGNEPFLFLIADAMFDVDFHKMLQYHNEHNALVTLFTHPNSHPYDSSVLVTDDKGVVLSWLTKEDIRPKYYKNRVNAGLQIIDPSILDMSGIVGDKVGHEYKVDMDRMLLKPLCGKGVMFCYDSSEYCKDMGTPERFSQVSKDFADGIVSAKNFKHPQKAFFMDIEVITNRNAGFCEYGIFPYVVDAVKQINNSGYLVIVISNQIEAAKDDLSEVQNKLETELGIGGAYIDGLYTDMSCGDKSMLIKQVAKDYNIQLTESWMVTVNHDDIATDKNIVCKKALIGSVQDNEIDIIEDSLFNVVMTILSR